MALRLRAGSILTKMGRLGWEGRVTHMLTNLEITSPVGAILCFSALSKGVRGVLINFFLKLLCQLGVLNVSWKKGNCNCVRTYAGSVECCQEVGMVAPVGDDGRRLHIS